MARPARLLIPLLALSSCSLGKAPPGPPGPPTLPSALERPVPFPCPPRALAGLTLCLDPVPGPGERKVQVLALYLARLLEKSGAGTALTRFTRSRPHPSPEEATDRALDLSRRAHALLLLRISATPPARRPSPRTLTAGEALLAEKMKKERALGGERARVLPLPREGMTPEAALWVVLPGVPPSRSRASHRLPAQALFRAVLAWWKAQGVPRPPVKKPGPGWPAGALGRPPATVEEARLLLQAWRKGSALDPTQGWLQVALKKEGRKWILQGSTEFPALAAAACRLLRDAGLKNVENRVRFLPGEEAGSPPFGVVRAARALTWARPRPACGLAEADGPGQVEETEVLYGDPVRILDRKGPFLLVHAASGYLGWIEQTAVLRCGKERFLSLLAAPRAALKESFEKNGIEIPAGALLPFRGEEGESALLESAGGGILRVPLEKVAPPPPPAGPSAAGAALASLGTPYLFGGRDREEGIDCSGLVRAAWQAQGIHLPRDARMQVLCGRLVGWSGEWRALRPGDLLFFMNSRGRISHTALSLGGSRFIHATPPEVTLGSLDPSDPWYTPTARRFVLAKRIHL